MITVSLVLAALVVAWFLAYHRSNGLAWSLALAGGVLGLTIFTGTPLAVITALWIAVGVFAALSIVKVLRRAIVSGPIFGIYKKILPQISQTEQEALDA
ncbi:MAG TPA: acyl-CoA dehydrogenase, partial [Usitatibacter sp.]|nr:acyl-CoA dehydrogenase [Usitatibacter sp.]